MIDSLSSGNSNPVLGHGIKLANFEKTGIKSTGSEIYRSISQGTEAKRGMEIAVNTYGAAALYIADKIRLTSANSLSHKLSPGIDAVLLHYKDQITEVSDITLNGQIRSSKDILARQSIIKIILEQKYGIKGLSSNPTQCRLQIYRLLKNKEKLSEDAIDLIYAYKQLTDLRTIYRSGNKNRGKMKVKRYVISYVRRYLNQTELGRGTDFVIKMYRYGKMTLRSGIQLVRSSLKAANIAAKLAILTAVKAGTRIANTSAGKAISQKIPQNVKNGISKTKINYKKVKIRKKTVKKRLNKIRGFLKDPLGIKKLGWTLHRKFLNTKLGKAVSLPSRILGATIGRLIVGISTVISSVITILILSITLFIIVGLITTAIYALLSTLVGVFDLSMTDEQIRMAALEEIKSCYEQQEEMLLSLSDEYNKVTINFVDMKDESAYDEAGSSDEHIKETTNAKEMLAMTNVYFDFDLEAAGEEAVLDYIDQLYDASHVVDKQITAEQKYVGKDESTGEDIYETVYNCDVTVTTYYFNDIFNVELGGNTTSWDGDMSGLPSILTQDICYAAVDIQNTTGLPASVLLAQIIYESGSNGSKLSNNYNNLLGITHHSCSSNGTGSIKLSGNNHEFEKYSDPVDSMKCWASKDVIFSRNYDISGVSKENGIYNATEFITAIAGKYCEGDPSIYIKNVTNIIKAYNLDRFNCYSSGEGQDVVNYARGFIGNPYKWGGTSLTNGTDCSGFTMKVFEHFGYKLPHSSKEQRKCGTAVPVNDRSKWLPGDLICYEGHVAIYTGNGMIVHASNEKYGILETTVEWSHKGNVIAVRRIAKKTSVTATSDEVRLLAACIEAEAAANDKDRLAVGAVVMNRVKSKKWPNSISGVIKQKGQFSTWSGGQISSKLAKGPSHACISAAKKAIAGDYTYQYTSFRASWCTDYGGTQVCPNGNRYK